MTDSPSDLPSLRDVWALAQSVARASVEVTDDTLLSEVAGRVLAVCRQLAQELGVEPGWLLPIISGLAAEIQATPTYAAAAQRLQQQRQQAEKLITLLLEAYQAVLALEAVSNRRRRLEPAWWDAQKAGLTQAFLAEPEQAAQRWYTLYAEALVDGQLTICRQLTREPLPYPPTMLSDVLRFVFATEAIQADNPQQALDVLLDLVHRLPEQGEAATRAGLWVLIGRIHLYRLRDVTAAQTALEHALALAPRQSFTQAAMGHFFRDQDQARKANPYFKQAIELGPGEPEGYVGMAWLAEGQGWWAEARDYYDQAVAAVADEVDPITYLNRLLNPVSGNLYLHLARYFHQTGDHERALTILEQAHTLGLRDETAYPNRHYYWLKGDLLRALGQPVEAGAAYHTAATQFYWLSDYAQAARLFRRAWRYNRDQAINFWYLADILRIQSYRSDPPYVIPDTIRRSCQVWQAGAAKGPIAPEESWAYLARATIADRLARVPGANMSACWWEAAAYVERALLCEEEPRRWAALAMYYRFLDLDQNGLTAARHALAANPDNRELLEEQAGALINIGEFEEATQILTRLIVQSDNPESRQLYQSWEAVARYFLRQFDQALALVQAAFQPDTPDLWERKVRANIQRLAGQVAAAQADYAWIWERRADPQFEQPDYQVDFGWAGYHLGYIREALPYLQARLEARDDAFDAALDLALCYLTLSDIPAAETMLRRSLEQVTVKRQVDEALILLDEWRDNRQADDPTESIARETISRFRQAFAEWETDSAESPALVELEALGAETADVGAPAWLATQAARGRLYRQDGRWADAAAAYRRLLAPGLDFPEARLGLEKVAADSLAAGQHALRAGSFDQTAALAQAALSQRLFGPHAAAEAEWRALAGLAAGAGPPAQVAFTAAFDGFRAIQAHPAAALGQWSAENLASLTHYWQVDAVWQALARADETREWEVARNRLRGYLEKALGMPEAESTSTQMLAIVTQLAVELGQDLAPPEPNATWPLFTRYMPELRSRLQLELGVTVPPLRVRVSEADSDGRAYFILIDEIPVVMGRIPPGALFAPHPPEALTAAGVPAEAQEAALVPVSLKPGAWVAEAYAETVTRHGLTLFPDPLLYLVAHLEERVRRALPGFVGEQEIANLLESWGGNSAESQLIAAALPDAVSRRRFGRVVHALLSENVPITDWRALLAAVRQTGLPDDDVYVALRAARQQLQNYLPGNQPDDFSALLPPEIETGVALRLTNQNGRQFLALPPVEAQELLRQAQLWLAAQIVPPGRRLVAVVRDAGVRPYVRRLLELESPDLMVIAQAECLPATPSEAAG